MAKDYPRSLRVAEQLHREIAILLRDVVHDPRIGDVTIADVEVSNDLGHARVYYSMLAGRAHSQETHRGLVRAGGFLRRELGKRLHIRYVPQLHFVYDDTQERGDYLDHLIKDARKLDRAQGLTEDDAPRDNGESV